MVSISFELDMFEMCKVSKELLLKYDEIQIFFVEMGFKAWNLNVLCIWPNWVLVKLVLSNTTVPLYFLNNINNFKYILI